METNLEPSYETVARTDDTLSTNRMMHAVRTHVRGGPEGLVYEEAPIPALQSDDALISVRAVGITPGEFLWNVWETPEGSSRLPLTPGHEVAGVVAAVGPAVTEIAVGTAIYALTAFARVGAAAEYVAVRAADLAPKPRSLSFAEAAATPLSALTAWQALIVHGGLRAKQRVLIHGAAGGVGTFAVQIARWCGAYVIGTASARDAEFLTALGCDEVIDYRATRFEDVAGGIDLVLDTIGHDTTERSWRVIRPGGTLVTTVPPPSADWATGRSGRGVFFVVEPDREQLAAIGRLIDEGVIKPIVAAVLPLAEARTAYERGLHEHPRGKIVLRVGTED